jgi:hypothetical protein
MRRPLPRRLFALAWLLSWLAAPLVSLVVLVHLASDDHHDHHRAHQQLALTATHGHSHPVTVAEHRHTAVRESSAPALSMLSAASTPAPATAIGARLTARAELSDPSPPTGSPPLFARHCALLL